MTHSEYHILVLIGKLSEAYDNFDKKLDYFYQKGGNDKILINCIFQIEHKYIFDLTNYIIKNANRFNNLTDEFGFSALYYFKLIPLDKNFIDASINLGFKEILPKDMDVIHNQYNSYYHHINNHSTIYVASTAMVFLGYDKNNNNDHLGINGINDEGAIDINIVHNLFMKGYNAISIDARNNDLILEDVLESINSLKRIDLIYIAAHGSKSNIIDNMHTISLYGSMESVTYRNGNIESTKYNDHISFL